MKFSLVTLDVVHGPFSEDFAYDLKEFAYGAGFIQGGFSYLIKRVYLEGWLKDHKTDGKEPPPELIQILTETTTPYIIICYDEDLK